MPAIIPSIQWNWDQAEYVADWHEPIFGLMSKYIIPRSTVLEVGAGGSHTLGAISARLKCRTFGVEPDLGGIHKTVQFGSIEGGAIALTCADGFRLPFGDGEFDVVYSLGLIEHFEQGDSLKLVREHARVCAPGGTVIVAVPNLLNLPHTLRKLWIGKRYEYYPERSYTPSQLSDFLVSAKLHVKAMDGILPLWGLSMFRSGWRVIAALDKVGIGSRLKDLKSAKWRSLLGYMTYAIAEK